MGPKQQTKGACRESKLDWHGSNPDVLPLLLGGVWLVRLHSNGEESISVIDITCFSKKAEKKTMVKKWSKL